MAPMPPMPPRAHTPSGWRSKLHGDSIDVALFQRRGGPPTFVPPGGRGVEKTLGGAALSAVAGHSAEALERRGRGGVSRWSAAGQQIPSRGVVAVGARHVAGLVGEPTESVQ